MVGVSSPFEWVVVESSAVKALCFQGTDRVRLKSGVTRVTGRLYVCYKDGGVYLYEPMLRTTYVTLLHAESIGQAVWKIVPQGLGKRVGQA